ncbi:MAG: DNRLRE domain-containing protein [Planctomycetaceae bacterium]|nr:DNRLRE domain-containing protein [Planctomycetaceae bacterium]
MSFNLSYAFVTDVNQDCYVDSWNPTTNNNNIYLIAGNYEEGRNWCSLFSFKLPTLADGQGFAGAYLGLTQGGSGGGDTSLLLAMPILTVTGAWTETTCTWNNKPTTGNLVAVVESGPGYNGEYLRTDVHKAVVDAGSGGTLNVMIGSATLQKNLATRQWYSKEQGWKPHLALLIGPAQRMVSVAPTDDCYVYNWNYGAVYNSTYLTAGYWGQYYQSLLKFTLPTIAADEVVTAAKLSLYQFGVMNSGAAGDVNNMVEFPIRELNSSSWSETTCAYRNMPSKGVQIGTLRTCQNYNARRISTDVVQGVENAGSGGTLSIVIDNLTSSLCPKWYSKNYVPDSYYNGIPNATDYFAPRLELTIVKQGAQCTSVLNGDVSGDCKVNFVDVYLMAQDWLQCTWNVSTMCQ